MEFGTYWFAEEAGPEFATGLVLVVVDYCVAPGQKL